MANPWFRLYAEFADDPKVQIMSEAMQRRLLMLMCSRCKEEVLTDEQRAFYWRVTPEELEATKRMFVTYGFIDTNWNLRHWDDRQFISDSSKERVKRYRDRREALGLKRSSGSIDASVIFKRDRKKCVYCLSPLHLCIDHVIPLQKGGTDEENNLATACKACNSGKAGRTPEEAGYTFKNPEAAARYKLVTERNGYSDRDIGGGVTAQDSDSEAYSNSDSDAEQTGPSARETAKVDARSLSQAVNPESHEDLSEWVDRIAVAYPRSRLKSLGPLEVYPADKPAIVDAILLEAGKGDVAPTAAAEMLLGMVEALGDAVPREQWQFLPRMTDYFAQFEYRRDPETFKRARGGASNGKRTAGNENAFREYLSQTGEPDRADSGSPKAAGGDVGPGTDDAGSSRLHGDTGGIHPGGADHDVHQGNGRVQVLSSPGYPPRVQWPSRHR